MRYLDTRGQPTLGIGICDRCGEKFMLADLHQDPNSPGLRVCIADKDQFDPYRLPARQADRVVLPFYRPDTSLAVEVDFEAGTVIPFHGSDSSFLEDSEGEPMGGTP